VLAPPPDSDEPWVFIEVQFQADDNLGPPDAQVRRRIESADADTLLHWSERVLTAQTPDEVLSQG